MGAIHFSIDADLIAALRAAMALDVFVETGTFNGDTAAAVAQLFRQVITIELSPVQFRLASGRLSRFGNIRAIEGNSPNELRYLRSELQEKSVVYWLDAHWCGAETAGKDYECPILEELNAIGKLNDESVVLIDDARLFLAPPPKPHRHEEWPTIIDLIDALKALNPGHGLAVINDVIVFYPAKAASHIIAYGQSKGVDLHRIAQLASASANLAKERDEAMRRLAETKSQGAATDMSPSASSLNALVGNRSERIFAMHLNKMGIGHVLDIGSNCGQFAKKLRSLGFGGMIYSIEPQKKAYSNLLKNSAGDLKWLPLARQGVGAESGEFEINTSFNSWSSSILKIHDNHVRAAPSARIVGSEKIFLNKASSVLIPEIMSSIEAVKIDVQGYESIVLDGFEEWLGSVRLLMLEMSLSECYVGAPEMFELDARLVNRYGFTRVSLEPSFYDEGSGTVQQFDGIYFRPNVMGPIRKIYQENKKPVFVTSIGGNFSRVRHDGLDIGSEWKKLCVQSWRENFASIISISEQDPSIADVKWVATGARPSIAQMFHEISCLRTDVILGNADLLILPQLLDALKSSDDFTLYYGQRTDVRSDPKNPGKLLSRGPFTHGFDYFYLTPKVVSLFAESNTFPPEFLMGDPWWDCLLPILALAKGIPVKRLPAASNFALHYIHENRYKSETWVSNGFAVVRLLKSLMSSSDFRARALASDVLGAMSSEDPTRALGRVSQIICESLP